jgi:hypothetical protein
MGDVAGVPDGHTADEAEQTPQAPQRTTAEPGQRTEQPATNGPTPEQAPTAVQPVAGSEPVAAHATEQAPKTTQATAGTEPAAAHTTKGPTTAQVVVATEPAGQQTPNGPEPAAEAGEQDSPTPGFGERGRIRRRARFLRKARELAYRDLGGLVFDLHRFGQRNDPLVLAKLASLRQIDTEVRELEGVLRERRSVTVLREVGIAACPRCAAIHGSDDRFCPGCGLAFDTNADRPISTAPLSPQAHVPAPAAPSASVPQMPPSTGQPPVGAPRTSPKPPAPTSDRTTFAQPASAPTPPRVERPSPPAPPKVEPAPPVKPTAAPVAAKPTQSAPPERKEPNRAQEDEPTQILRPPTGGS